LPKDLKEMTEKKKSEFEPNKLCLWWTGKPQRMVKAGMFSFIPLQRCVSKHLVAVSIGSTQDFIVLHAEHGKRQSTCKTCTAK